MAGRGRSTGGSSGRGKRASHERGRRPDSAPIQRRRDRHYGGPPQHIVERQAAEIAKRQALKSAAVAALVAPPPVSMPITAPCPAIPAHLSNPAPQSAPSVPPIALAARVEPAAEKGAARRPRHAAALLGLAIIAAPLLLSLVLVSRTVPPSPITPPQSVADAPLRTDAAIRQRILEMTPVLTLTRPEPALPGSIRFAALALPPTPPDVPVITPPQRTVELPARAFALAITPPDVSIVASPASLEAMVVAPTTRSVPQLPVRLSLPPLPPVALTAQSPGAAEAVETAQCQLATADAEADVQPVPHAPREVGPALAAAAFAQTRQFVVYDARYTRIAFPGGDVASLHGVCTDVVVRAYRSLGIDLQRIVFDSRIGIGDTSIDHRRTETLRRFLATAGESLPVSLFAEDYLPGDIVTYHRPQNRISTAHIAIVSDRIAPSGRPMIIHNRGLGVQIEDALFVDRITGHYRYAGPREPLPPLMVAARPRPAVSAIAIAGTAVMAAKVPASSDIRAANPRPVTVVRAAAKSPAAQKLALRFAQQQQAAGNVGLPSVGPSPVPSTRFERMRP